MLPGTLITWLGLCAMLAAALPSPAYAQRLGGHVVLQGWHEPTAGAEVLLLDAEALTTVAQRTTGADGGFVFETVAPGVYHLQAQRGGLQSALLGPFEVRADDATDQLRLELPSTLLNHALACERGTDARTDGVLVGVAHEARSGLPLPGAVVSLEWRSGGAARRLTATADAQGHYRFCAAPAGMPLRLHVTALNRVGDTIDDVVVDSGAIVRHDIPLQSGVAVSTTAVTAVRRLTDGGTAVGGRVLDSESGDPVPNAVVRVADGQDAVTDTNGRFRLTGVPAGTHALRVERIGYDALQTSVELNAGFHTDVELRLGGRAIALASISVEGRSVLGRRNAIIASRMVTGEDLRRAIDRGATLQDVVRSSFPVQVREWRDREGRVHLCIDGRRREIMADPDFYSLDELPVACGGETVAVVVDDVLLQDPVGFYRAAKLDTYETIEYMPPLEAGIRFGLGAGRAGAIVLWSIGRTPPRR